MGVSVNRVDMATFALGSAIAAQASLQGLLRHR